MKKLERVRAFLRSQSTMNLATIDASHHPHSTPLFFVADDELRLYWFSSAGSAHSRQCSEHPSVSVSVYRNTEDWRKICGVQMRGIAAAVHDHATREPVEAGYIARFHLGAVPTIALQRSLLYRFTPTWIRFLDNSRRLGYKFELDLKSRVEGIAL